MKRMSSPADSQWDKFLLTFIVILLLIVIVTFVLLANST